MKTLVLGIGNTIRTDDGVGIHIVRELKNKIDNPDIDIKETSLAGFILIDLLRGYDRAIVVDSIKTTNAKVGDIYKLTPDSFKKTIRMASSHEINFATAVELGKKMNIKMPAPILIYAIEIKDNTTFSEQCTPEVQAVIPKVIRMIEDELKT